MYYFECSSLLCSQHFIIITIDVLSLVNLLCCFPHTTFRSVVLLLQWGLYTECAKMYIVRVIQQSKLTRVSTINSNNYKIVYVGKVSPNWSLIFFNVSSLSSFITLQYNQFVWYQLLFLLLWLVFSSDYSNIIYYFH